MTTATRYWLFQIPGLVITIALLFGLRQWVDFPIWAGVAVMALLVVKDAILYPFLKPGYERDVKTGIARLVGGRGIVKQTLEPEGFIQIAGELWKARAARGDRTIVAGSRVLIRAADGMTLIVSEVNTARRAQDATWHAAEQ